MKKLIICLIAVAAFAGCSSKPKDNGDVYTKKNKAAEYSTYGNTYYDSSMYGQAMDFFKMALELNISVNNEAGMIENYNSIGKVHIALGDETQGEKLFLEAMALAVKLNDPGLYAKTASNLGEVYLRAGKTDKSRGMINEALEKLSGINGENETRAVLYHNAGVLNKHEGNFDEALRYFEMAKSLNEKLERRTELAANYYMIASIQSKLENYPAATASLKSALENDKRMEHSYGIAKDIHALAVVYSKSGEKELSYDYYKKAYLLYNTLRLRDELIEVLQALVLLAPEEGTEEELLKFSSDLEILKGTGK